MKKIALALLAIATLTACDQGIPPSVTNHPDKARVQVDEYTIYVVKQAGNQWVASGGEKATDGFVEYRQKRAIEVQSKCRVNKVLSTKGAPLLRVSVHQCRA